MRISQSGCCASHLLHCYNERWHSRKENFTRIRRNLLIFSSFVSYSSFFSVLPRPLNGRNGGVLITTIKTVKYTQNVNKIEHLRNIDEKGAKVHSYRMYYEVKTRPLQVYTCTDKKITIVCGVMIQRPFFLLYTFLRARACKPFFRRPGRMFGRINYLSLSVLTSSHQCGFIAKWPTASTVECGWVYV